MDPQGRRQRELADFIKCKRAALRPEDAGLDRSRRRRTQGLRREEVAVAAGVGLTWYTWLEQGREIQVSASFLENVSSALKLNEAERTYLFTLAQRRPPPFRADDKRNGSLQSLSLLLEEIRSPAYARTNLFDVVAWNKSNSIYFGDFGDIPSSERNIVTLMFTRDGYKRSMPNWEQDARDLVANLRLQYGEAIATEDVSKFDELIASLRDISSTFRKFWDDYTVTNIGEGVTHLSTPRMGSVIFRHITISPEIDSMLKIVTFIPLIQSTDKNQ